MKDFCQEIAIFVGILINLKSIGIYLFITLLLHAVKGERGCVVQEYLYMASYRFLGFLTKSHQINLPEGRGSKWPSGTHFAPKLVNGMIIWTSTLATFPRIHFRTFWRNKNAGSSAWPHAGVRRYAGENWNFEKIVKHPCKIHRWKAEHKCGKLVKIF